jgi:hypothetical protein
VRLEPVTTSQSVKQTRMDQSKLLPIHNNKEQTSETINHLGIFLLPLGKRCFLIHSSAVKAALPLGR